MGRVTALFLLAACQGGAEPTPEEILKGLASWHAEYVFERVQLDVEEDLGSLYELESGGDYAGSVVVAGHHDNFEADWALHYTLDDEGLRTWDWTLDPLSVSALLETGRAEGTGTWTVRDVAWDLHYADHAWAGSLALDGADAVPVEWTAHWSGNLHRVDGAVDGEAASWVNPNPDLP